MLWNFTVLLILAAELVRALQPDEQGTFVSFAQTGAGIVKKATFPANKWTMVKKYPDDYKLKGASMVSYRGKMLIFGGCKEDLTCSNSIFAFDLEQEKLE